MFFCQQELKKVILEDLVRLGKASGLHSFEQVGRHSAFNMVTVLHLQNVTTNLGLKDVIGLGEYFQELFIHRSNAQKYNLHYTQRIHVYLFVH